MLQPYYTMRTSLQNAEIVIAKRVAYYKMRRYYKMPQNSVHFVLCSELVCILNAEVFSVKPKPAAKTVVAPLCCRNPKCDNPN